MCKFIKNYTKHQVMAKLGGRTIIKIDMSIKTDKISTLKKTLLKRAEDTNKQSQM